MQVDKLNRWRWILLISAVLGTIVADAHSWFTNTYIVSTVLGITSFAIALALGVLLIIKPSSIPSRFKALLFILYGIGIIFWFITYIRLPRTDFLNDLKRTIEEIGEIFVVGIVLLLLFIYHDKTSHIISWLIPAIITGLVLNRMGADSEAMYMIFMGYFLLSACILKEAIISLFHFRKQLFLKRLFFLLCLLLCVCTTTLFFQNLSFTVKTLGVFDLIVIVAFLIAALSLLIAMPFSNYLEWPVMQKKHFIRIIILPTLFLFTMMSMRFVLPPDTYKKIFFKGHSGAETHFQMEEYNIRKLK
ncbi:MAG: hypothetical protein V2B15_10570 [Bacteroidota bacterium]